VDRVPEEPDRAHPYELELSAEAMREMVDLAMDRIVAHLESLPSQPMHATRGGKKIARALREPMPERGTPFPKILRRLFGKVIPTSLNTASPGYLAYVPGGGLFHAAVADLVADAVNRYVGVWLAAPGLVQIEANVIAWLCAAMGLPEGSFGVLTTGGSMANLIAVVTARGARLPADFLRGTIYTSDQAHHSVQKAALFAGFPEERVRVAPTDARFRVIPAELERLIAEDRAAGLAPFLIVGHGGTTNTGAVDDLDALATLAARQGLWLHVDAAYGGFFALTDRGRARLRGVSRADSITLDPHKGMFLPYGTGCLLVRDREALRRAHAKHASYLPPMQTEAELVDFCDLSPELSRDWRGLRVWLPLKMHGVGAFRRALDEKLDLAQGLAERLAALPDVELVAPPELSLLAFRVRPAGHDEGEALDALNRAVLSRVNEKQRVLLTGTVVRQGFVIRVCILSFRTHQDRIDACFEDVRAGIDEALGRAPA
jgi:aromatic-L-amino-acid decarboxylase